MMKRGNSIAIGTMVLALGAIGYLGIPEVLRSKNLQVETLTSKIEQLRSQSKHLSGVIETKSQDSFGIQRGYVSSTFVYEIWRVRTPEGVGRYLVPQPTEYQPGDKIDTTYTPLERITFKEIFDLYGDKAYHDNPMQTGYLNIDGIIERH